MPIQVPKKINVQDLNQNIGIGVSLPFNGPGVFVTTYTTRDQIRSNIINFLLTNRRERVFNPNFGANLRELLFSQIDDLDTMKQIILDKLAFYFGNLLISEITIEPDADNNTIRIHLVFTINGNLETVDSVQINIA